MKIYLAGPVKKHKDMISKMANIMRDKGYDVYLPSENKIKDAWNMSNFAWATKVFDLDWEMGYAYGIGKKIVVVHFEKGEISLMIGIGSYCNVNGLDEFKDLDLENIQSKACSLPLT